MKTSNAIAFALSSAFAVTIGTTAVHAAENPFAIKPLTSGYQVANSDAKDAQGKCGNGKCSAEMAKDMKADAVKGKEGSGNGDMKAADMKAKEGSCHGDMKGKEGSCHGDKNGDKK